MVQKIVIFHLEEEDHKLLYISNIPKELDPFMQSK